MTPELIDRIVKEARSWIGTPYHHKSMIKGVGVDCGGLLYQVYKPIIPAIGTFPSSYAEDWSMHKDDNEIYLDFIMPYVIEVPFPIVGGVSVWKYGRNYAHGSIVVADGRWVHAYGRTSHGQVLETKENFFHARHAGKRPVKHYKVDERWL